MPQHKTSTTGTAPLTMTSTLFDRLTTFVNDVRTILETYSDNIFLTQEGNAFNDGTLGRTIISFWKNTGVRPDISMTSTRLRKMGTSTTKEHRCREAPGSPPHDTHRGHSQSVLLSVRHNNHHGTRSQLHPKNIGYSEDQDSEKDAKELTEEDKKMLCIMFEEEINTNTPLTITSISNKLVNSSSLLHVLASGKTLKQATNHLRYQQAKHTKASRKLLESQPVQKKTM